MVRVIELIVYICILRKRTCGPYTIHIPLFMFLSIFLLALVQGLPYFWFLPANRHAFLTHRLALAIFAEPDQALKPPSTPMI